MNKASIPQLVKALNPFNALSFPNDFSSEIIGYPVGANFLGAAFSELKNIIINGDSFKEREEYNESSEGEFPTTKQQRLTEKSGKKFGMTT